ncbi:MAG TPA: lytic transglycosylase domain-containing protein [Alphaproteobacteria bacterium]
MNNRFRRLVFGGIAAAAIAAPFFAPACYAQAPAVAQTAGANPARAVPTTLTNEQKDHYRKAFAAVEAGRWDEVRQYIATGKDPLANKVLRWLELQEPRSGAPFEDIAAFIDANPHWPGQDLLARRAEEALVERTDDSVVLAWFALRDPATVDGAMRYAEALFRSGNRAKAIALVRNTWLSGTFGEKQESMFIARYKHYLSRSDHARRLDNLLWEGRHTEARRMMRLVDPNQRALAEARIRLAAMAAGVDGALRKVPDSLVNDPGLLFERMRWRRRKGQIDGAMELMQRASNRLGRPEIWWSEREILARKAIADGRMSDAYRLVRNHHLRDGAAFAEAEFLAGWIALRYLDEPRAALMHFTRLYEAVRYPVSLARGAYWAGRAAEALGDKATAQSWYAKAAAFPVTYYGQLARTKLDPKQRPSWPKMPEATAAERRAFEAHELTRVVRLLSEIGVEDRLKPFILRHVNLAASPGQHALVGELAMSIGRPDLAVSASKRSAQIANVLLPDFGWPILPVVDGEVGERALLHAMIRQESAFEARAISPAGARGMMQLMPATARAIAKTLGLRHSDSRLLTDPEYNLQIGRSYLARMIEEFDGSYVLALAAYNAGPNRVRQWVREYGDPRQRKVDVIDWIELIPFDETRNYVQRVLENLQVYRRLLGSGQLAQGIHEDLRRGATY